MSHRPDMGTICLAVLAVNPFSHKLCEIGYLWATKNPAWRIHTGFWWGGANRLRLLSRLRLASLMNPFSALLGLLFVRLRFHGLG